MKQPNLLLIAVDDSHPPPSFPDLTDYNNFQNFYWPKNSQLLEYSYAPDSLMSPNATKSFGMERSYRALTEDTGENVKYEIGLAAMFPIKSEYAEDIPFSNTGQQFAPVTMGDRMYYDVNLGQMLDACAVKPDVGFGMSAPQLSRNTNEVISAGYYDSHSMAASIAVDPVTNGLSGTLSTGAAGAAGAIRTAEASSFTSHFGLSHRHSFPDAISIRSGLTNVDFYEQYANYNLTGAPGRVSTATSLIEPVATHSILQTSNYTLDQRRSVSEVLENMSPGNEGLFASKWNVNVALQGDCCAGSQKRLDGCTQLDDPVPLSCMSARERWAAHRQNYDHLLETQKSMVCAHCDVTFDVVEEYLEHLDTERVKHENFCPDPTCAFAVIGFRFRWLLRRHICNHHLKAYNSDVAKNHTIKGEYKLLKQFLSHVYVCTEPECSRAFYRLDSLLRHQRLIHGPGKKRSRKEKLQLDKYDRDIFD